MSERPERVHVSTDIFEALVQATESLPGGQVARLLVAAYDDVQPYAETEASD